MEVCSFWIVLLREGVPAMLLPGMWTLTVHRPEEPGKVSMGAEEGDSNNREQLQREE